ncbi:Cytochrome P450, partial [Arabidopsis suecica]
IAPIWFLSLLFLSCILLAAFKHKKRRKNQQPPSPPGFPIIGNLHQLGELPHQSLWSLSKTYGPVMLLKLGSVPTVVVSSSETAKQALKIYDLHCCSRPSLAELFSAKRVHSIQPIKEEEVKKLIDSATESASQKSPVNLSEKFLDLTASVICKAAFGLSFHSTVLNNDGFDKLIREAFLFLGSFSASNFFPNGGWIIDWLTGSRRFRGLALEVRERRNCSWIWQAHKKPYQSHLDESSSWGHQYFCNDNDMGHGRTYKKPASDEESTIRNQKPNEKQISDHLR